MIKKKEIFEALRSLAILLGADVTNERLTLYCHALEEYDLDAIKRVIVIASTKFARFPVPAELIEIMAPKEEKKDQANEMAGQILE
jgi:hypothetical protein